ncbi:SDR family NAD(P)-dependent oxidoreductase [Enemella evansiae]|uniref:SDR family NAD(P)-dependent oxidoreductase n=1 Tax=Enemella evansiae TaxID=2016499 RepID=UPI000B95CEA2|nr:SDR family NAD(P)-dependent oxidoreductase [Enemella evansiae]OYO00907.1 3-oxoacyl-ACP reductase [Enemella evansiae]OYO02470.1 3-oxoacyl-ACP reductase [Enemella evansiae]OYO12177.1 3-oxoacyl-ACP reductase [Enemella evansiae]
MTTSTPLLTDKVAVVTGAGQGLGRAYALELARQGAAVVVNDIDAQAAQAVVDEITDAGGRAVTAVAPVGPTSTADALVAAAVDNFGRLDVMVTNAGLLRDKVLWKMSDDDFDQVIEVHLRGTFTCARAAAIRMREQGEGGRIICVASPAGQRGNFGQTNYSGAKAGIAGMVRTWAMELAKAGITVNAVAPVAATAMTETIPFLADHVRALAEGVPLPDQLRHDLGFGTPEDAAGLISFLASDSAAGVTGQVIAVGGDRVALWSHPQLTEKAYHAGGFSAEDLIEIWPGTFAEHQESVGEDLPEVAPR